jgi:hypothetical protein
MELSIIKGAIGRQAGASRRRGVPLAPPGVV